MGRNRYSVSEFIGNTFSLILTKISFPQARLLRRPIYIRGGKSIEGARNITTGHACRFDLEGERKTLFIGENCEIGDNVHIVAHEKVVIGDNVLMASKVFISDTNHGIYKGEKQDSPETTPNSRQLVTKPVKIGNNVWIGENVVILAGSEIGDGCVIGANSVITKVIESNSMVVGNSKIIKRWTDNQWTVL